jgi:hypothetical protein
VRCKAWGRARKDERHCLAGEARREGVGHGVAALLLQVAEQLAHDSVAGLKGGAVGESVSDHAHQSRLQLRSRLNCAPVWCQRKPIVQSKVLHVVTRAWSCATCVTRGSSAVLKIPRACTTCIAPACGLSMVIRISRMLEAQ